jgi:hypothetical protein
MSANVIPAEAVSVVEGIKATPLVHEGQRVVTLAAVNALHGRPDSSTRDLVNTYKVEVTHYVIK